LYKNGINDRLKTLGGKAKARDSYKIFGLDHKAIKEYYKNKYGASCRINTLS
jgi:hypothetical protein